MNPPMHKHHMLEFFMRPTLLIKLLPRRQLLVIHNLTPFKMRNYEDSTNKTQLYQFYHALSKYKKEHNEVLKLKYLRLYMYLIS